VPPFDAVIFDLDGTLCRRTQDTQAMYERAFAQVDEAPFGDPQALWDALEGPPDHDDIVGYFGAGFARVAAQYGHSGVEILELSRALVASIDNSAVAFTSGAETALEHAAAAGKIGIVTNGPETRQRQKIDTLGISHRFDTSVYAAELSRSKPHTVPFDRAIESLDTVRERTLYIGNSLRYDVAGAHNAGLPVAWLQQDQDVGAYKPDFVIDSLAEVPGILRGEQ